ncbi:transcriptional regulator [Streptomyces sp. HNM0663]|uniref:Transcriptional regulator n=1 Tax=Streptomyces chengmaiensis TaxID=3040919 RepID=A0ABT6HR41_9ACTN|nr:transcriptional regulator [Streptomyces chengmaiensis]MDH2390767.1 transcriptional regulator [Streptomyces chengmaiensis]
MTHEAGAEQPGVQGRLGCAGATRGTPRTRRLAEALRRRRRQLGLSLGEMAERLAVAPGAYPGGKRTGEHTPDSASAAAVTASDGRRARADRREAEPDGRRERDRHGRRFTRRRDDAKPRALLDAVERAERSGAENARPAGSAQGYEAFGFGGVPLRPSGAPLRPSGPVPPSGPRRPAVPTRPVGPARPSGPVPPYRPPAYPAGPGARPARPAVPVVVPDTQSYLRDYAAMMDAVPLPSLLFDRRWNVAHANPAFDALFRRVAPHPTAMPTQNFLRFVLFHPDAATVLADHETSWCLPLMAQLESALESDGEDRVLRSIREDIAGDPIMDAAYRCGLPHWMSAVGAAALHHDGAVRPLWHPDPRWGRTDCRIVDETPRTLQDKGYTRMTLVLRETRPSAVPGSRRGPSHLRAVPGG